MDENLHTTPKAALAAIFEAVKPSVIALENGKKGAEEWDGYCGFRAGAGYQRLKCLKCGNAWTENAERYRHKEWTECPDCGKAGQVLNLRKYRNPITAHENLVVVTVEDPESVWVECLRMEFFLPVRNDLAETEIAGESEHRVLYHLTPGKAEKWRMEYSFASGKWEYRQVKKVTGHKFMKGYMYGSEEGAVLCGAESLKGTFLRFANPEKIREYTNSAWSATEYLIHFAKYPVWTELIEKLRGIESAAPPPKPRGLKYRTARTVAELFPALDKERLRILLRLIGGETYTDVGTLYKVVLENQPELIRRIERAFGAKQIVEALAACQKTKKRPEKIAGYLERQKATARLYLDYLGECEKLGYDLGDEAVLFPKNLTEKHAETSGLCRYRTTPEIVEESKKRAERLKKSGAEYAHGRLMIRVPRDCNEIIAEGAQLGHCVGGYAVDHTNGRTTILFIRRRSDPETPYFTLEINEKTGNMRQCYGFKNRESERTNLAVEQLLEHYKRHLEYIKNQKKTKGRKTA